MSLTLDTVITRIEAAEITGKRPRVIGRNSHREHMGDLYMSPPYAYIRMPALLAGVGRRLPSEMPRLLLVLM